VEVTELGRFRDDGRLVLTYAGTTVCDLPLAFVHGGLPRVRRRATWTATPPRAFPWEHLAGVTDFGGDVRAILGSWNVCSKEWVIRQYDHEVQGGSALKPLVGVDCDGPGDAAVVTPVVGSPRGVAVSCGLNPRLGDGSQDAILHGFLHVIDSLAGNAHRDPEADAAAERELTAAIDSQDNFSQRAEWLLLLLLLL